MLVVCEREMYLLLREVVRQQEGKHLGIVVSEMQRMEEEAGKKKEGEESKVRKMLTRRGSAVTRGSTVGRRISARRRSTVAGRRIAA